MPHKATVIGGGVVGTTCAYYLARDGWEITLLERGQIGGYCSYANACLIVPSHSRPLPGPGVLGQALRWIVRRDSPLYVKPRLDREFAQWAWASYGIPTTNGSKPQRARARQKAKRRIWRGV